MDKPKIYKQDKNYSKVYGCKECLFIYTTSSFFDQILFLFVFNQIIEKQKTKKLVSQKIRNHKFCWVNTYGRTNRCDVIVRLIVLCGAIVLSDALYGKVFWYDN